MEWKLLTNEHPNPYSIIYINYKVNSEWKSGFHYFTTPYAVDLDLNNTDIYWVYAEGLSINISYPY